MAPLQLVFGKCQFRDTHQKLQYLSCFTQGGPGTPYKNPLIHNLTGFRGAPAWILACGEEEGIVPVGPAPPAPPLLSQDASSNCYRWPRPMTRPRTSPAAMTRELLVPGQIQVIDGLDMDGLINPVWWHHSVCRELDKS